MLHRCNRLSLSNLFFQEALKQYWNVSSNNDDSDMVQHKYLVICYLYA